MPTIGLKDQFGLDIDAKVGDLSGFAKYFANLPQLSLANLDLKSIAGFTLENPAIKNVTAGLNFSQPVEIGAGGVTLSIDADATGSLGIFVPPPGGGPLFQPDPYGDNVAVAATERYVSLVINAKAGAGIHAAANQLQFGFTAGVQVSLANYRRFEIQPAPPSLLDAVTDTVANFCIPGSVDDLRALAPDALVILEGSGTVTASGTANLLATANPLAGLSLPAPLPALEVSAGASVTIGATCRIAWEYQLRIRKIAPNRITLGFYRKHGTETTVSVDVHGGISAGIKGTDLFSTVIGAVSPGAAAGAEELSRLGLEPARIADIQTAVQSAAQRKLEVALLAGITESDSTQAAFLYEFDLTPLDSAGNAALVSALRGDLSPLGGPLPAGVTAVRSIFTDLERTGVTWKLNLLGVLNFVSVFELVRQGTVLFEPASGDLVITDTATAKQISAETLNFGADTDKLRRVLAGSFLITAAYHGTQAAVGAPVLGCSQTFFELHAATSRQAMQDELDAAFALGLVDRPGEQRYLGDTGDFGRTLFFAENSYDSNLATALFLTDGEPKTESEYDRAGRNALALLIREDSPDAFRRRPAMDDSLWSQMREAGQPSFAPLFPDLGALQVQVIAADYTVIVWWADAMSRCASCLAAMRAQIAVDSNPGSPKFQALRQDLAKHLAAVARTTKEEFGRPWGLVAMDLVSGRRARARAQLMSSRASLSLARTLVQRAGT